MKPPLFFLTALVAAVSIAPARAADKPASIKQEIQLLQNQIHALQNQNRALQDQIDVLKAHIPAQDEAARDITAAKPVVRDGTPIAAGQAAVVTLAPPVVLPGTPQAPMMVESPTHRFSLSSADGQYTIGLTGRVQLDLGGYVNYAPRNPTLGAINASTSSLSNGFNARRARIGVTGKAAGDFTYTFIYDAGNSQDATPAGIEFAQIGYTGFKNTIIEAGYSDTFFALEEIQSSNDIMFLERASAVNIATSFNAGDFRANAGFRTWGDNYWVGAYVTGPANSDSHTLSGERLGAFQRAAYNPIQENHTSVHVGLGVSELISAPNTGPGTADTISLSDRPELRIDPTNFLNTGALGTVANPVTGGVVYNIETAALFGNLFYQGEYFHYVVDRRGLAAANFDGGYGEVSYTFGGHRTYIPNIGAYSGVTPDNPFSLKNSGAGAFELAARISYMNLIDQYNPGIVAMQPNAVNGGKQTGITLGLNWYMNSNMRWMFNWVHSDFHKANAAAAGGIQIGDKLDALAVRWQFAY